MAYDSSDEHLNSPATKPGKSWRLALFLSASLGFLAIDRFYLGKIGTGILKLLTIGGLGIWWLVDFILIALYDVTDARGTGLRYEGSGSRVWWRVATSSIFISTAAAVISVAFLGFLTGFKGSEPYQLATQYASENELIKAEIGEVIGFGFLPQGSISTTGPTGEADLSIGVKGERGDGTLYAKLVKRFGEWKIIGAEFETPTGHRFNLLMPGVSAKDITEDFTRVANIPVSTKPWRVTLTPDGKQAYVLHRGSEAFTIIDIDSRQVEQTVQLGFTPTLTIFSRDSKLAFLAGPRIEGKGSIAKFDTMSKSVSELAPIETSFYPLDAAFSSEGRRLYVGNTKDRILRVFDPVNLQMTKRIPLDDEGFGLATLPDGSKLYVTHYVDGSMSVINTESETVVEVIEDIAQLPVAIAISADGRRAFIAEQLAFIVVLDIDASTPRVLETINNPFIDYAAGFGLAWALSFSKNATQLMVWDGGRKPYVAVIDLSDLETKFFIRVEEKTSGVAIDSTGQLLVMSNEEDNTVSILRGKLP